MEGMWKFNPFYWIALDRLDRANQDQKSLSLACGKQCANHSIRLNPLRWSSRTIRAFFALLLIVLAPVYFFSGIQPVSSVEAEAASYPELRIPDINLNTPVAPLEMNDRQLIAPATIAGSYSQAENKQFIIGHSSTVFQNLDKSNIYQHILYNDIEYTITTIETLAKADIDMDTILSATDVDTIVIMTCAGAPLPNQDATHRLIITAERSRTKSKNYIQENNVETTNDSSSPEISKFIVTPES